MGGEEREREADTRLVCFRRCWWLTVVDGHYNYPDVISVLYHAATARLAEDRSAWLAHVCGTTFPKISATLDFQSALLANISKCYCFLLNEAAAHL